MVSRAEGDANWSGPSRDYLRNHKAGDCSGSIVGMPLSSISKRYLTAVFVFHRRDSRSAADIRQRLARRSVPEPAVSNRSPLFDYLVGAGEQYRRYVEAERLGGVDTEHQLVFGWRLGRAAKNGSLPTKSASGFRLTMVVNAALISRLVARSNWILQSEGARSLVNIS